MHLIPIFALGAVVILIVMAGFLAIRGLVEWRQGFWRKRMHNPDELGSSKLLIETMPKPPKDWSERVDQAFDALVKQTGSNWSTDQVLGLIALLCVCLAGAMFLWRDDFWLVAMAILLGAAAPLGVLLMMRANWRRGMQNQLPDAFFLLARSLRAGESLEQALETVAEHGTRPLAQEFRRGVEKIKLGLSVPAALRGMARRVDLADFRIFVTAVTLHRTVGGNLTQLLDRVAASTRDRNTFRGYVLAATALSRITGFFIAAAAPVLFFGYLFWQPDFISSFTQSAAGIRALWIALGLELVGVVWTYYLLRIDY